MARHRLTKGKQGIVFLPPTTDAVLHNYKEPLRAVPGGFGYLGTLAYDKTLEFTQCHICGYFYKHLHKHIRQLHDIGSDEYRVKFGLQKGTSLLATNTRSKFVEAYAKKSSLEKLRIVTRLNEASQRRLAEEGNRAGRVSRERSLEWYNKRGTCPDQIIDKIITASEKFGGRAPSSNEFIKLYGKATLNAARHHFGTWKEAVKISGLTPKPSGWGKIWSDEAIIEALRNFKKMYGREPFYSDMRTKQGLPSAQTVQTRFGKWSTAKCIAFERE